LMATFIRGRRTGYGVKIDDMLITLALELI
jgi:hypothetical protein